MIFGIKYVIYCLLKKLKMFMIENKLFRYEDNLDIFKSKHGNYNVAFSNGSIQYDILSKLNNSKNLLLVDKNVFNIYFKNSKIDRNRVYIFKAIEENKNIKEVLKIINFLSKNNFTKDATFIICGGGITEDVGEFVSTIYKRGIKYIYFPTTLLSQCDSCIGNKVALNHNGIKNQLALFVSSPSQVIINMNFLKTLTEYDINSGMGEILKLLVTGNLMDIYNDHVIDGYVNDFNSYKKLIKTSLCVKKAIVEEDEFENHYRKSLNYGHTIGHALEILSEYKIPHGQAVSIGMIIANKLALNRGLLIKDRYDTLYRVTKTLIDDKCLEVLKTIDLYELFHLLKNDKKTEGDFATFIVPVDVGNLKFLRLKMTEVLIEEINTIIREEFHG